MGRSGLLFPCEAWFDVLLSDRNSAPFLFFEMFHSIVFECLLCDGH